MSDSGESETFHGNSAWLALREPKSSRWLFPAAGGAKPIGRAHVGTMLKKLAALAGVTSGLLLEGLAGRKEQST